MNDIWPPAPSSAEPDQNTSGTTGPIPPEIERARWNWGAFGTTWIWLAAHNMIAWAVLVFFVMCIPRLNLGVMIGLGAIGNGLGRQNRRFDSMRQFQDVQRRWATWGIVALVPCAIVFFVLLALWMPWVAIVHQLSSK